jgi:hypothetical protein
LWEEYPLKHVIFGLGAFALVAMSQAHGTVDVERQPTIITASNAANNQLLVYNTAGALVRRIPTGGQGGVSGNAGGIAQNGERLAVVNFQSSDVSVFYKDDEHGGLRLESVIPVLANPVSVAFGHGHLYVLTTTHVESHRIEHGGVGRAPDGAAPLLIGDGSAAQVGVLPTQLIFSEKSNAIETVNLNRDGAIEGRSSLVSNIPANVNAPFGLVTRGEDAYVTIAHANEISLVRDDTVLTVVGSGTQQAPCWVTLDGPFLFSANSPSQSVSRYAVYGRHIIQDAAVVAQFNGDPTDITYRTGWAAVVDANGNESHVSVFRVDGDGTFTLKGVATIESAATNGIALVGEDDRYDR